MTTLEFFLSIHISLKIINIFINKSSLISLLYVNLTYFLIKTYEKT